MGILYFTGNVRGIACREMHHNRLIHTVIQLSNRMTAYRGWYFIMRALFDNDKRTMLV